MRALAWLLLAVGAAGAALALLPSPPRALSFAASAAALAAGVALARRGSPRPGGSPAAEAPAASALAALPREARAARDLEPALAALEGLDALAGGPRAPAAMLAHATEGERLLRRARSALLDAAHYASVDAALAEGARAEAGACIAAARDALRAAAAGEDAFPSPPGRPSR